VRVITLINFNIQVHVLTWGGEEENTEFSNKNHLGNEGRIHQGARNKNQNL